MKNVELITIDQSAQLPHNIALKLEKKLHIANVKNFADGQTYVGLNDPYFWQHKHAVIIQSTYKPVQKHILQVSFLAHELKNAGVVSVLAVLPYFGYSRQERSDIKGKPGPAQVIAKLYEGAGIDSMIMVELHTPVIQKFFSIPTHNILLTNLIADHIKDNFDTNEICLIAPDKGVKDWVGAIAQKIKCDFNVFEKERYAVNKTRIVGQIGNCKTQYAIMIDDIIDTGGTAIQASEELIKQGFSQVYGYFVHGVFSKDALVHIEQSPFTKIFVSNTIPQKETNEKVKVFDVSAQIVKVIKENV